MTSGCSQARPPGKSVFVFEDQVSRVVRLAFRLLSEMLRFFPSCHAVLHLVMT